MEAEVVGGGTQAWVLGASAGEGMQRSGPWPDLPGHRELRGAGCLPGAAAVESTSKAVMVELGGDSFQVKLMTAGPATFDMTVDDIEEAEQDYCPVWLDEVAVAVAVPQVGA